MATKYPLVLDANGFPVEIESGDTLVTSALPSIVPFLTATAGVDLAANDLVNLYLEGGQLKARLASATNATTPIHGYVLSAALEDASATVYTGWGELIPISGLTTGTVYYLSTSGGLTSTPPSTVGNIVQRAGVAISSTHFLFEPGDPEVVTAVVNPTWTVVTTSDATVSPSLSDAFKWYRMTNATPTFTLPSTSGATPGYHRFRVTATEADLSANAASGVFIERNNYDDASNFSSVSGETTADATITFKRRMTVEFECAASGSWVVVNGAMSFT